jgi:hypothetical protein
MNGHEKAQGAQKMPPKTKYLFEVPRCFQWVKRPGSGSVVAHVT